MTGQVSAVRVRLSAQRAGGRRHSHAAVTIGLGMAALMLCQAPLVNKGLSTHEADKRADARMPPHVSAQAISVEKALAANGALVWSNPGMAHLMDLELAARGKGSRADSAVKRLLLGVRAHVLNHVALLRIKRIQGKNDKNRKHNRHLINKILGFVHKYVKNI
jgi:hypothetical protein